MYPGVYTFRFPIHLSFADACPACQPAPAGLDRDGTLRLGYPGYPMGFDSLCTDFS